MLRNLVPLHRAPPPAIMADPELAASVQRNIAATNRTISSAQDVISGSRGTRRAIQMLLKRQGERHDGELC